MAFLLDSNVVIEMMDGNERVLARAERAVPGTLLLSTIVLFELLYGAFNSNRVETNLERVAALAFPQIALDDADAREAGRLRAALRRQGAQIGPYDLLIAGQALARDLTLVTNNTREFARVDGLKLADWTLA